MQTAPRTVPLPIPDTYEEVYRLCHRRPEQTETTPDQAEILVQYTLRDSGRWLAHRVFYDEDGQRWLAFHRTLADAWLYGELPSTSEENYDSLIEARNGKLYEYMSVCVSRSREEEDEGLLKIVL